MSSPALDQAPEPSWEETAHQATTCPPGAPPCPCALCSSCSGLGPREEPLCLPELPFVDLCLFLGCGRQRDSRFWGLTVSEIRSWRGHRHQPSWADSRAPPGGPLVAEGRWHCPGPGLGTFGSNRAPLRGTRWWLAEHPLKPCLLGFFPVYHTVWHCWFWLEMWIRAKGLEHIFASSWLRSASTVLAWALLYCLINKQLCRKNLQGFWRWFC